MRGHIWDNFSSETYKQLPAIGAFEVDNPYGKDGKAEIDIPGGGPGYYRPPSLISLWSSAPYLHNNTVGDDFGDPSVDRPHAAFQEGIERMLLIRPRKNIIWRTTTTSYINVPLSYIPPVLQRLILDPRLKDGQGNLKIGPIPKDTPINLLANTDLEAERAKTPGARRRHHTRAHRDPRAQSE